MNYRNTQRHKAVQRNFYYSSSKRTLWSFRICVSVRRLQSCIP